VYLVTQLLLFVTVVKETRHPLYCFKQAASSALPP